MRRIVAASVFVLALVSGTAAASAQSPAQMSEARDLFRSGLDAARQGRWQEAREAFERSLAIVERPSTLVNLAGAQAQTGRLVAAAATYRRFLEVAEPGRLRDEAESSLAAVETRIARLTIAAVGLEPHDELRLDADRLDRQQLASAIAVDPGVHVVRVVREGQQVAQQEIALGEGEVRTVALEVAPRVAVPEPAPVVALGPSEPETDSGSGGDDTWVWVGIGIGAAVVIGVAVGVAFAVTSSEPGAPYQGNLGDGLVRFD